MAVLRSADGKFYDIPDTDLEQYEIPADEVKAKLGEVGMPMSTPGPGPGQGPGTGMGGEVQPYGYCPPFRNCFRNCFRNQFRNCKFRNCAGR